MESIVPWEECMRVRSTIIIDLHCARPEAFNCGLCVVTILASHRVSNLAMTLMAFVFVDAVICFIVLCVSYNNSTASLACTSEFNP